MSARKITGIAMHIENRHWRNREWFRVKGLKDDLRSKSVRGGINTSVSQFVRFGLSILSTFILARMLLPSDFGMVSMVTAFTGLAVSIQDVGLSMAVVQKDMVTHRQVSYLFWINIIICFSLGILFVILSPLIVALYHNDIRLYPIIFSYAAGIGLSGMAIQHNALLNRRMMFGRLARINIFASIFSIICAIVAALLRFGYWAIVVLNISSIFFTVVFSWISCSWRPSLPRRREKVWDFLNFGAAVSGFNIVNYFSRNSDDIIIGRFLGSTSVGIYSKAYQLLMLPISQLRNPLMAVAIPAMSALKNDTDRYIKYYRKYVFVLAFFSMPLVATLGIFSDDIIMMVLGKNWLASSPIFRVLAIAGFIQPVASSGGLVLISKGKTKRYFWVGFFGAIVTVAGFLVGIRWGVLGVATAFVVTSYISLVPTLWFCFKGTPISLRVFFIEISLPVLHTFFMGVVILLLKYILVPFLPGILVLVVVAPVGTLFFWISWRLYPAGRAHFADVRELFSLVAERYRVLRKVTMIF